MFHDVIRTWNREVVERVVWRTVGMVRLISALQHHLTVKSIVDRPIWILMSINPLTPSRSPLYASPGEYRCGLSTSSHFCHRRAACSQSMCLDSRRVLRLYKLLSSSLDGPTTMRWLRSVLGVGTARSYFCLRTKVARCSVASVATVSAPIAITMVVVHDLC